MAQDDVEKWHNPQLVWGLLFLIMVLLGLAILGDKTLSWLRDEQKVPIRNVLVSGDLTRVTAKDIEKTVKKDTAMSLFSLDVDKLHSDIESLPWVYQASIRKSWPDTLRVYVVEQEPVAHWNQDMLLNKYGGVFDASLRDLPVEGGTPLEQDFPQLFGPGGSEVTVLQGLRAMQGLLDISSLEIQELSLSERYAWQLKLSNGIHLRLGRTEFIDRLQRFIDVYPLLLKNKKAVEYVDLRYDTGLAVGWREPSAE